MCLSSFANFKGNQGIQPIGLTPFDPSFHIVVPFDPSFHVVVPFDPSFHVVVLFDSCII